MADEAVQEQEVNEQEQTVESPLAFTVTDDGSYKVEGHDEPMSRRQFIQTLFTDHDMHRRDIGNILDLKSNQVYQATVNMENSHHGPGRGSGHGSGNAEKARELARQGKTRPEIVEELGVSYGAVYAATKSLDVKSARSTSAEVTIQNSEGEEVTLARPDAIRELASQGLTRPQIKEQLDCSYAVVWAATKNMEVVEARSNRVMVEMDDGRTVPRVDAIREYADKGWTRRQIADKLDLDYSVVWATTKNHETYQKEDEEEEMNEEVNVNEESEDGDENLEFNDFTKAQLVQAVDILELDVDTNVNKAELVELLQATDTTPEDVAEALGEHDEE